MGVRLSISSMRSRGKTRRTTQCYNTVLIIRQYFKSRSNVF